jgi:hypothetical protein
LVAYDRQTEILDGLKQQARDEGLVEFLPSGKQGGAGVQTWSMPIWLRSWQEILLPLK